MVLRPGHTRFADIAEACRRLDVIGVHLLGCVLNATSVPANAVRGSRPQRDRSGWVPDADTGLEAHHPADELAGTNRPR